MTKHILIAGLLGGLLGGVVSFTLSRTIKPVKPEAAASTLSELETEGRKVGDDFVAKLRAKDFEGFAQAARTAFTSDQEYAVFKKELLAVRDNFTKDYGSPSGEFELVHTRLIGESAIRLVYMEKFDRGGLMWLFIIYRGKDGWKLDAIAWNKSITGALAVGWFN